MRQWIDIVELAIIQENIKPPQPHNPRNFNPALMTVDEYIAKMNPSNAEVHPHNFNYEVSEISFDGVISIYPRLLQNLIIKGEHFQIRLQEIRKRYKKTDQYSMSIMNDKGEYEYESDEENKAWGRPNFEFNVGAFNAAKQRVGYCADNNGMMKIAVAKEYRGYGIGPIIGKIARTLEPDKRSGGLTPAGRKNLGRVHREFVRDALTNGLYREKVLNGEMTIEEVRKIIKQANLHLRPKINHHIE